MHRSNVPEVARRLGLPAIPSDWSGLDVVQPILERMRRDGAVFLFKVDGERGPGDTGPYTALVSGAHLGEYAIRTDAHTLEDALAYCICEYATRVWNIALPD